MSNSYNFQRVRNDRQNLSEVNAEVVNVSGNASVNGSLTAGSINPVPIASSGTYNSDGGSATLTAAQLLDGYTYNGAAGGAETLTLPDGDALQTELATRGVTSASGLRLGFQVVINVSDANNLTVTAGTDGTILGTAAVNNQTASVNITFTGVNTYVAVVVLSA